MRAKNRGGKTHSAKVRWCVAISGQSHSEITFVVSYTKNTFDKQTETDGQKYEKFR